MSQPNALRFDRNGFALIDSAQFSVPLAGAAMNLDIWEKLPWSTSAIGEANLGDLPCRLDTAGLRRCLQSIWRVCAEGAMVSFRIPHPRHDCFLRDIGYVKALLPESFGDLDPSASATGLGAQLGVRFKLVETTLTLDPHWQRAIDQQQITSDDIALISKQANNVIEWVAIRLQVSKSAWVPVTPGVLLTPEMKTQLQEQLEAHVARGDHQAAETIRRFLEKEDSSK